MFANINTILSGFINGRSINEYEIETSIGNFYVVEWENAERLIERKIFENKDEANKKYRCILKAFINGKI